MKQKLYNLLKEWLVCEYNCDHCQHSITFFSAGADGRHPCNRCQSFNNFKIANHLDADLKDKVKEIIKITKKE